MGMAMPSAKLLIFGNPKGGTPLMMAAPSIALDLPLKILVAEDERPLMCSRPLIRRPECTGVPKVQESSRRWRNTSAIHESYQWSVSSCEKRPENCSV